MQTITSIGYNMDISIIKQLGDALQPILTRYGSLYEIDSTNIEILPAYPKDLTKFKKPAIIVQRTHSTSKQLAIGNVLGEFEDGEVVSDVVGTMKEFRYQIIVEADKSGLRNILSSTIVEILDNLRFSVNDRWSLFDFITDIDNPTQIGSVDIEGDINTIPSASNDNKDYQNVIMLKFECVQHVIPIVEMIDLSKGFKIRYNIKL